MMQTDRKWMFLGTVAAFFAGLSAAFAAEVSGEQAAKAARAWLARTGNPMECGLSDRKVASIETRTEEDGAVLFHVVRLEGGGTVVTSGDTGVEPVVAFSDGNLDAGSGTPLGALLEGDMRQRGAELKALKTGRATWKARAKSDGEPGPEEKWAELLGDEGNGRTPRGAPIQLPSKVETYPLIGSHWGQGGWKNSPESAYLPDGAVAGCMIVAMAQILAYYDAAANLDKASRTATYTITVKDGGKSVKQNVPLQYESTRFHRQYLAWTCTNSMPDMPDGNSYDREKFGGQLTVGKLLQTCGALLGAEYTVGPEGGTRGGMLTNVAAILKAKYAFQGATCKAVPKEMSVADAIALIPGEVAKSRLVCLDVYDPKAKVAHAVLADGFGKTASTWYTHLNMGWNGSSDMWYNLQGSTLDIPAGSRNFNTLQEVLYDLRPEGWLSLDDLMAIYLENIPPAQQTSTMLAIIRQQAESALKDFEPTYIREHTPFNANGTWGLTNQAITVEWRPYKEKATYTVTRYDHPSPTSPQKNNSVELTRNAMGTQYTDTTAKPGVLYRYTVKRNEDGEELVNMLDSIIHVASPKKLDGKATQNGVELTWTGSEGAAEYLIYRAGPFGSEAAARAAELVQYSYSSGTNTTFTDREARKAGYWYQYGVRAYCQYTGLSAMPMPTVVRQGYESTTNRPTFPGKPALALERGSGTAPSVKATLSGMESGKYWLYRRQGENGEKVLVQSKDNPWWCIYTQDQRGTILDTNVWAGILYHYWLETEQGVRSDIKTIRLTDTGASDQDIIEWEDPEEETQTVTFDGNGGEPNTQKETYTIGRKYGWLPAAEWTGHEFDGWWTLSDGGNQVTADSIVTSNKTRRLYAHWITTPSSVQTVTFRGNGGTPDKQVLQYAMGRPYGSLPTPSKEGCDFAGWWTAASGGTQVTGSSTVTTSATRTLYAHWTAGKQTVTFKGNGGTPDTQTKTYAIGGTYGSLPTATRTGYVFAGWWTSASGGTRVMDSTTVTTDATRTLYAHWTPGTQTVTFKGNGGTPDTQTKTYTIGGTYGNLATVTRTGYVFAGWWTAASGGTQVTASSTVTTESKRMLYAHWTAGTQTVTFKGNGGTPETQTGSYTIGGTYGSFPSVARTGHVFAGWWTAASGGTQVTASSTVSTEATRTLYAQWRANTYKVTLDRQGGTGGTTEVTATYGSAMPKITVPTKTGYTFGGYYTAAGGSGTQYYKSDGTSARAWDRTSATTLYAKWTANTCKVTLDPQGGTGGTANVTATYGSAMPKITVPTKTGYTFGGYYTAAGGSGTQYYKSDGSSARAWNLTSTAKLYAKWTPITYKLNYKYGGGAAGANAPANGTFGTAFSVSAPTRTNYAFAGWTVTSGLDSSTAKWGKTSSPGTSIADSTTVCANGTGAVYFLNLRATAGNVTLTAGWTLTNQVVRFEANGGTCSKPTKNCRVGGTYGALPTATWPGHVFLGWYTAAEGGSVLHTNSTVNLAETRTFWAHWTDRQVVTFKGNGGLPSTQKTTNTIYAKYGTFPTVAWANHVFLGWYTAANAEEGKRIYTNSTVTLADKRTLWAQWSNQQVVTFRGNGGTPDVQRTTNTMGKAYGTLPAPKRSGHVFLGWFTAAEGGLQVKGTDKATVATARTLWAHWTDQQVTVFKGNGGTPSTQRTTNTIYAAYGELPTATRSGHVLVGWYTEANGGKQVYTNSTVTLAAERTLFAHWSDQQVVTFKGNGGTPSTQKTTNTIYAKYGSFPSVEWANHVFLGWYTAANAAEGKRIYTNSTVSLAGKRTLWAQWNNQQVVTFRGNGGTPDVQRATNTMGKAYGALPAPKRSGQVFLGWFTAAEGGAKVKGTDKVTTATERTLWAHWTDQQVTVFKGNGGTPSTQRTTNTIYAAYGELPTATRSGHVLVGWYTAAAGGKQVYADSTVTLAADRTLFAHWSDQQVVTFKGNGGTPSTQKTTNTIYAKYGSFPSVEWANHVFLGWYTAANAEEGKRIYTNSTVTLVGKRTLWAQWINQQVVTFKGNGGTPDVHRTTNTMGKAYGTLPTPKRSGHVFLGWFTAAEGGTKVKGTDKATAETARTLWAHWTDQQVTVFKGNGGTPSTQRTTNTIYAAYGELPEATRSGHVLVGWYTEADGGKQVYTNSTVTFAAERTLYAHWSDQQVVTFKGNGGTPSTQKTTNTIYAKYGSFPSVEWANHVFLGWYTAANAAEGKRIYTNSTVTQAGKRTLWAQWSNQQVVTFRGNGGTPDVQRVTNTMGKAYGTLPTPKRSGQVFLGWFTDEKGGTEVKRTDTVTVATARTLWAHWTDRQVTVFNGNGGSPAAQRTTNTISALYGELPTATRPGHVLVGWYTAADGGKRVYTNSTVTLTTDRTLYAHWTDKQVVTFKGNGGTPSTQKTTNTIYSAYGELPTAKRPGQALVGWFTAPEGGRRVSTNSTVTLAAERTLYAHWTDQQVTTFIGNGGTPATQKTTNAIYSVYGELPVAAWSGHVFQGWYNAAEGGNRVYTNSTVTLAATRTLYAHWTTERGFVITALAVGTHGRAGGDAPQADSGADKGQNVCHLRFELSAGAEYEIQWTAAMDGEWETVERLTAETDGEVEVEIEVPGGEKGFFRLVVSGDSGERSAPEGMAPGALLQE